MDIAGLSMALSANQVKNDVGVAMLKNGMDQLKTEGEGMVSMIESAPAPANPNLGANVDVKL